VLVEQNAQALRCADKSYIMEGGENKAEGTSQELMSDEEIGKHYLGGNMIELIVYGIVLGSIIALGSVGLTLIWGITDLFNNAHGDQITVGAYIALLFSSLFSKIGALGKPVGPFRSAGRCSSHSFPRS